MKHLTHCPECGSELHEAAGIAIYCPNDDCPVEDDPALWDGNGNRAESPIKLTFKGGGEFGLSLDEFKRLQKLVKQQAERIDKLEAALLEAADKFSGVWVESEGRWMDIESDKYRAIALDKEMGDG